jgi:MFS family permease
MNRAAALFRENRQAWIIVGGMWAAFLLAYTARQSVSSTFGILRRDLGFTEAQLGLTGTVFLWTYAVMNPIAGQIGDRFSRPKILWSSLLLWSLATVLMGLAWAPWVLLGGRAALAIAQGLYAPTAVAYISQIHSPATRATAITMHGTAQYAGVILGGWYGGMASESIGFRGMFFSIAAATVVYSFFLKWLLSTKAPVVSEAGKSHSAKSPLSSIFANTSYLAICVAFVSVNIMLWIVYTWLPEIVRERFRLSAGSAGLNATAFVQIAMIAGLVIGAPLGDWASRRSANGRIWVMAAGLFLSSPFIYLIAASETLNAMKLASIGYGVFKGLFSANIWAALLAVSPRDRGAFAVGFCNSLGGLFGGVSSYLVGLFRGHYPVATMFGAAASVGWIATLFLLWIAWRIYQRDAKRFQEPAV